MERATRRIAVSRVALTGVLAGVLVAALSANVAAADGNVINACYQKQQGQLRLVKAGQACLPSELPISWNIQGPVGPTGPIGPTGAQGQQGIQGPAGVSGLETVSMSTKNNSNSDKTTAAQCPEGKKIVGGGAQVFIGEPGVKAGPIAIKKSWPNPEKNHWAATAEEISPTDLRWFLTAYAICATVDPAAP